MTRVKVLVTLAAVGVVVVMAIGLVTSGSRPDPPAAREPETPRPSTAGAVRAATRFLVGMNASTLLDTAARRRFVRRWSVRSSETRLQRMYDAEAERLALLDDGFARAALLGYRVNRTRARAAAVIIWAVSLASVGDARPVFDWRAFTVQLGLEGGRWRVADVTQVPGPRLDSPPRRFRRLARRFQEYRLVP